MWIYLLSFDMKPVKFLFFINRGSGLNNKPDATDVIKTIMLQHQI